MSNDLSNEFNVEENITSSTRITHAFKEMLHYRSWSQSTIESYCRDIEVFETFLGEQDIDPILHNAKLHVIQK
ncbi:site-specific integrase [Brevibacillus daliensis]|uniref:site-specific integrase n=1 Tax=Brevibacillus daliensis TaxID=2892995 RepID=UPI001E465556|nr:site-specific integrase [Brevibacillus daliensis]